LIDRAVQEIERIIEREVPEAEYILANANRVNSGYVRVSLVPKNKRTRSTSEIANALRRSITGIPGASIRIREGQGLFFLRRLTSGGGSNSVELELRGHDLEKGQRLANEILRTVEGVDGVTDVRVGREAGIPEFILRIDRKKAADLGLTASQIGTTVKTAMGGAQATTLRREGKEFAVQVRLAEEDRRTLDKLRRLTIINRSGVAIPVQAVAKISEATGPEEIDRRDRERIISIDVNYSGKDLGSIVESIRNEISTLSIPSDFAVIIRGDYEEQQKSFRELMVGLLLAVILIYLVMAGQFESFKGPFVILFAIPMALIGIVLILYLTATPFSMQAYIGCIILAGIVVNNAIVLVDYMNRLRRDQGFELFEAIKNACARRLRPIMMTALTTSLGLLPLAFGLGEGGETQAPMARVVIGGLLSSSFITLILIPVIYSIVEERHKRKRIGKGTARGVTPLSGVTAVLILTIFCIFFINNIQATESDTLKVSLQDVLKRSAQHNPIIRIDRIDVDIAKAAVREQQFMFEPAFSASLEQNRTIHDGESSDPEYEGTAQIAGVTPAGTSVSLKGSINPSSRSAASGKDFRRKLEMTFTQALLSKMGLNVNLAPVRKASVDLKISNEELTAYAQKLLADVERAYWDVYLAAEEVQIHQKSLELANRFLLESEEKLNIGRIAPLQLVVVRAELASRKKNLINAQTVYIQKKYRLLYLVNDRALMWNSPIMITDRPYYPQEPDSLSLHLEAAKEYRPDLRQANLLSRKNELDVIQTRNGLLPKLDVFFTLAGEASAGSFQDAFTGDYQGTSLSTGLILSLPVTNGIARQRYKKSVLSQKKIQISMENLKNLIELDVRSAWTDVKRTMSHIEAAGISRKLQEEKLNAEQVRFAAGKSTEYLVLQVQRDLISSQLDETRAQIAYCNAITNLYLKDGTLLERRGVSSK
jgi:outer membrane protein TolC